MGSRRLYSDRMLRLILLLWLTVSLCAATFGIQSGSIDGETNDGGNSYGGGMVYDADNRVIFLTGATYGSFFRNEQQGNAYSASSCFFAILGLGEAPDSGSLEDDIVPTWLYRTVLGTNATAVESCSCITNVDASKVFLGGQSEEGGLLTELRGPGSLRATQYGFVADLDVDLRPSSTAATPTSAQLLGGYLFHESAVQAVVALDVTPLGDSVYVASHESDSSTLRASFPNENQPNLSKGGVTKYGDNYFIDAQRFPTINTNPSTSLQQTLRPSVWSEEIATRLSVEAAGMFRINTETVVLSGSVKGSDQEAIPPDALTGNDYDGYVVLFDTANGLIQNHLRIQSERDKQDTIEGVCRQEEPNSSLEFFYVVGSTTGVVDTSVGDREEGARYGAFVMKIALPSLEIVWSKQLVAENGPLTGSPNGPQMRGLACAVTSDGSDIYIGGVVEEGAVIKLSGASEGFGGDDIFVAQIRDDGNWAFIRQMGTSQKDSLVDIAVDEWGNALVFGNTRGAFMRAKTDLTTTDVFVISVARTTGDHPVAVEFGGAPNGPRPTASPPPTPTPPPTLILPLPPLSSVNNISNDGGRRRVNGGLVAVIVVSTVCVVFLVCFLVGRRRYRARDEYDSAQVLEYLKGFDDVEVDLKHSATGGWHGSYVNHDGGPRYYGEGGELPETIMFSDTEMSPLAHSSIVKDSLFTDTDFDESQNLHGSTVGDMPAIIGGRLGLMERQKSSYDGLVEAYNTTWDDMNPYTLPPSRRASQTSTFSSPGAARPKSLRNLTDVDIDSEDAWGKEII